MENCAAYSNFEDSNTTEILQKCDSFPENIIKPLYIVNKHAEIHAEITKRLLLFPNDLPEDCQV